jgi:ubiquinone/menaquinone biosynthesis C-methylase UbiE
VASRYIDERFRQPLGALLHKRQAAALRRLLGRKRPCRVLEIAPGPGRLTTEIADLPGIRGTVLDSSAQMLEQARRRVAPVGGSRWDFVHGDAFNLPFDAEFDAVFVFRLVRHFNEGDRLRLYAECARVLKPGGLLVFDAINEHVSVRLRQGSDEAEYPVFDALLTPDRLRAELGSAGFQVSALQGVQRHYSLLRQIQVLVAPRSRMLARAAMEVVDRFGGGQPLEWIVTCSRA